MGAHYERCFYSCLDLGQFFGLMREKNQLSVISYQFQAKVLRAILLRGNQLNCYSIRSKSNLKLFRREAVINSTQNKF